MSVVQPRFQNGDGVQWWKPEDKAWSDATVVKTLGGKGWTIRDPKLPELVDVPAALVRPRPVVVPPGRPDDLADVVNVIDPETQVVITFPESMMWRRRELGRGQISLWFGFQFIDAHTGALIFDPSLSLHLRPGPEVKAELGWMSFLPGPEHEEAFDRNFKSYQQTTGLAFSFAAGIGQTLKGGATVGEAVLDAHRRSVEAAAVGLTRLVDWFARPAAPLADVIAAIKGEPGAEARIIILDDNHS